MQIDFFLIGFQKCATTWVYKCLEEHPDISMSNSDEVHFYDINFHKGDQFHAEFHDTSSHQKVRGESTSSYVRSEKALHRIHQHHPNAKFIVCLKSPVKRAVSHFWHERKKSKILYSLEDVFDYNRSGIFDLYNDIIETGEYSEHISKWMRLFPKENFFFVLDFEIENDAPSVLQKLYTFLSVDSTFEAPSTMRQVNKSPDYFVQKSYLRKTNLFSRAVAKVLNRKVYFEKEEKRFKKDFVTPQLMRSLKEHYTMHNEELSKLLGVDLNEKWGDELV